MDAIELLRQQYKKSNESLEATMQGVTREQAHWTPPGKANPLGATYAHVIMSQDSIANKFIRGTVPLMSATWAGKVGVSEMPPAQDPADWSQWARKVQVDVAGVRRYGQAVQVEVDKWLSTLKDSDFQRTVDTPVRKMTVLALVNALITHTHEHAGEISCLKGLQGPIA